LNRKTLSRISLATVAALLVAGCAAGPRGARLQGMNVGSTTGDTDSCSAALGNNFVGANVNGMNLGGPNPLGSTAGGTDMTGTNGGGTNAAGTNAAGTNAGGPNAGSTNAGSTNAGGANATANGLLIGNVALVALPIAPATGTGTMGTGVTGRGAAGTGAAGTGVTGRGAMGTGAAGLEDTGAGGGRGGLVERFAPGGTPTNNGSGAAQSGANAGDRLGGTAMNTTPAGYSSAALQRIRTACDRVAEIRVVNSAGDRQRLAEITAAMRQGRPVTEFMDDLNRIMQAATPAGGTVPRQQGVVPGPTQVR
jgi:hypothetical protein